jgi:phospholipase/carboxylesterase
VARHYSVRDSMVWLIGFSQGAALAHTVAAYHPTRVAGYCAHGGYFVDHAVEDSQLAAEQRAGVHVLLTHGIRDSVIPLADGLDAFNRLKMAGVDVVMVQMDIMHSFPPLVSQKVSEWLKTKMK